MCEVLGTRETVSVGGMTPGGSDWARFIGQRPKPESLPPPPCPELGDQAPAQTQQLPRQEGCGSLGLGLSWVPVLVGSMMELPTSGGWSILLMTAVTKRVR